MSSSQFFTHQGAAYHVAEHGSSLAPPLLLLHGFTGSAASWEGHIPAFAHRFRVLTVDILGHGRSDSPTEANRYAMPRIAADLIALLDDRQINQTAVLGYSMGGRLALYLACHFPKRFSKLVLESSSPGLASAAARTARCQQDEALADWIEASGVELFVNRWETLPLWHSQQQLSQETRQNLRQQRLQNNSVGLANSLRGMGTGAQPSLWAHLPTLTLPTLLVVGELDSKFVSINQEMVAKLPNGRLHIIPQAGHTTHLERPSAFYTAVEDFLAAKSAEDIHK